jgi:heptosyltransferase-2
VSPRRILIVRTSALGDVVLATSVLDPLREAHPGASLEWVTSPAYAPLLEGLPQLARVHALERGAAAAAALGRRLWRKFDVAIDLQHKLRTAALARAAAPEVVTFRRRSAAGALAALLGSDAPLARAHATQLYAESLAPLGVTRPGRLHVHLSRQARALAARALGQARPPIVAIAPGATWATKRWPAARFGQVAEALAAEGASLVLAGGPGDRDALAAVRACVRSPIAADLSELPLEALAAALSQVQLLVGCDSGPVHLCSAVGTQSLALFGPTSPVRWAPAPPGRALGLGLPCSPCSNHGARACPLGHHRCLADLGPEAVVAAARAMLAGPRVAASP